MRNIAPVLIGILLTTSAAAVAAPDPTDDPRVNIGDQWKYQQFDDLSNEIKFEFTHRVVDISPDEIAVKEDIKGRDGSRLKVFDPFWNLIDDGVLKFDPSAGVQTFPVTLGKVLRKNYTGTVLKTGASAMCTESGQYVAWEKITVPAGTFDALRFEGNEECRSTGADATINRMDVTSWYAPAVKKGVRSMTQTMRNGRVREKISTELVEYSLAH